MKKDTFKTLTKKGNLKLGTDTLIFNMGTAGDCPSLKNGLCKLGKKCYALKAEKLYGDCVVNYRKRQENYWKNTPAAQICSEAEIVISRMRKKPAYFRFNESGDFYDQYDVEKLDIIAGYLKKKFGIETYGYTARKDLDFSAVQNFMVKGSSNDAGNNGKTIARHGQKIANQSNKPVYIEAGTVYAVCPGDCRDCKLCKVNNQVNIVFPLH